MYKPFRKYRQLLWHPTFPLKKHQSGKIVLLSQGAQRKIGVREQHETTSQNKDLSSIPFLFHVWLKKYTASSFCIILYPENMKLIMHRTGEGLQCVGGQHYLKLDGNLAHTLHVEVAPTTQWKLRSCWLFNVFGVSCMVQHSWLQFSAFTSCIREREIHIMLMMLS